MERARTALVGAFWLVIASVILALTSVVSSPGRAEAYVVDELTEDYYQFPSSISVGVHSGTVSHIGESGGSRFYYEIKYINGIELDEPVALYGKCVMHDAPSPAWMLNDGKPYAPWFGDIYWTTFYYDHEDNGFGVYTGTIGGDFFGPVTYDRANEYSQSCWGVLTNKSQWQTTSLSYAGDPLYFRERVTKHTARTLIGGGSNVPTGLPNTFTPLEPIEVDYNKAVDGTSLTYHRKTPVNVLQETNTVWGWYQDIQKTEVRPCTWWRECEPYISYDVSDITAKTGSIEYKASVPAINQTKYTPWNLNYNSTAKATDTVGHLDDSGYYNQEPLQMVADNCRDITDGQLLPALDINDPFSFKTYFENAYYGMPADEGTNTAKGWFNTPPYEGADRSITPSASDYAFGELQYADTDRYFRYGLKMAAGINDSAYTSEFGNVATLKAPGFSDEWLYSGTDTFYKGAIDDSVPIPERTGYTFSNGYWEARFILSQIFQTGTDKSTKYPDWWVNKYTQGTYFEYGVEYDGIINDHGVYIPRRLMNGCTSSTGNINYNGRVFNSAYVDTSMGCITDHGETVHLATDGYYNRGVWVRLQTEHFDQPVLYGKWDVKTLAGDIS